MVKHAWIGVLFAAACGGGGETSTDAGADAEPGLDAAPMVDTDGDGILDHIDVCPTIADPAQVDLDGDHLGWMCDPVESTVLQHPGIPSEFQLAVRGNTAGASFHYGCGAGPCQAGSLSVGPGGVSRADSSTDAWLLGRPNAGWVSGENRVLWSFINFGIGEQHAATGTFTTKYDGILQSGMEFGTTRFERDQLVVFPSGSPTQGYGLLEPRENGDLFIIYESADAYAITTVAGRNPASLLFTTRASDAEVAVRRFVPGAASSEILAAGSTSLSHANDVKLVVTPQGALMGLCAAQDGIRYFIPTNEDTVAVHELLLPSCNVYGARTTDGRLRVLVAAVSGAHPTGGVTFMLDGAMHSTSIDPFGVDEVFGRTVPAAIRSRDRENNSHIVNAVSATGAVTPVASGVTDATVSVEGATIHVLGKRGTDLVLFRWRNGTASEVTLPAFPDTNDEPALFTTKEGAALVSSSGLTVVVPSQTMTADVISFRGLRSFVRGDATLFVASPATSGTTPLLFSYGEVSGVPQYTALTAAANTSLYAYPLDSYDGASTGWFVYEKDDVCLLARPEGSGATVSLVGNVPCLTGAVVEGVTQDNKLVVRFGDTQEELHLLDGDTMTKVATSSVQIRLMYAERDSRVVLGWMGRDAVGGFLCLGTHPERCWSPPAATHRWAAPVPGQPDAIHAVYLSQGAGGVVFTSIKSIGPGTRSQPLN